MGYKLYDFMCPECLFVEEHLCSAEDINGEAPPKYCPVCEGKTDGMGMPLFVEMFRRMPAPNLRTDNNSASYVDGTKRKGFAEGKIAADLEVVKAGTYDRAEKERIQKEILKTGVSTSVS
jgi:hypothetical protein